MRRGGSRSAVAQRIRATSAHRGLVGGRPAATAAPVTAAGASRGRKASACPLPAPERPVERGHRAGKIRIVVVEPRPHRLRIGENGALDRDATAQAAETIRRRPTSTSGNAPPDDEDGRQARIAEGRMRHAVDGRLVGASASKRRIMISRRSRGSLSGSAGPSARTARSMRRAKPARMPSLPP